MLPLWFREEGSVAVYLNGTRLDLLVASGLQEECKDGCEWVVSVEPGGSVVRAVMKPAPVVTERERGQDKERAARFAAEGHVPFIIHPTDPALDHYEGMEPGVVPPTLIAAE